VSIGVARAGPDDNAEALLANADLAMYRAKQTGRGRHEHYDHRLRVAAQRRARAEHELRRALARDELVVHYQPVVELPGRSVVGVEALVRWQRPDGTLVQPGEFIPVAEETGLISEIDVVVLRTACSDAVPWRSSDDRGPLTVAVNLSAQRFSDPALPDVVASVLDDTGLQASRLFLEITESTMMEEHEGTTATMERLLGLGVQLAIDDFGTGYSSLRYLKRFPVGALKIDRSFVDGLGADRDDEAIVEAVTGLARSLRLGAIGEGVETEVQCRRLEELGCRLAQGYLFGRPADAATTRRLLLDGARVRDR
jgi:EAL domain-containing protein (putative c-di-GMP-specific phosphodiesterase class I)